MSPSRWKAFCLLVVLAIAFYWKTLLTRQFSVLISDESVNQAYSWYHFWITSIRSGVWPVWDPFAFAGQPFAGEMQTGAFNPFNFLLALFPFNRAGVFSPYAYHIFHVVIQILGAFFMFCLIRELELSFFAGIVAAICFGFGGVTANMAGWPHLYQSAIWLPLILLFTLRALRSEHLRERIANSIFIGGCIGMSILAGGLHFVIMQVLVVVAAVVAGTLQASGRNMWQASAVILASSGITTVAAGAVQLFASFEYAQHAYRWIGSQMLPADRPIPYAYLGDGILPRHLVSLVVPTSGSTLGPGEILTTYLGVFAILLAGIGLWKNWGQQWVRFAFCLALGSYLYSLSPASFLRDFLTSVVPYLWLEREAARFLYVFAFAATILAAYGIQSLFANSEGPSPWEPAYRVAKWAGLASLTGLVVDVVGRLDLHPWVSMSLFFIMGTWALLWYILHKNRGLAAQVLVIGFILFDLYAFDWSATNVMQAQAKNEDHMDRLLRLKNAAAFLKQQPGPFRVQVDIGGLNIGDFYGIETTSGRGVTMLRNFEQFRGKLDLLNVRYILRAPSAAEPGAVYQDAECKIYENQNAYPRAWLVHQAVVEPSREILFRELAQPDFDARQVALLDGPLAGALAAPSTDAQDELSFATYDGVSPALDVQTSTPSLLVLSEIFYPGWKAAVNGENVPIIEVDGALRGILLPSGQNRVTLNYRPTSLLLGGILTTVSYLMILILVVVRFRAKRIRPSA